MLDQPVDDVSDQHCSLNFHSLSRFKTGDSEAVSSDTSTHLLEILIEVWDYLYKLERNDFIHCMFCDFVYSPDKVIYVVYHKPIRDYEIYSTLLLDGFFLVDNIYLYHA